MGREGYVRGQRFWSPTGGKKPTPEPQPDNRDGNEICIGVLNNFYADGISGMTFLATTKNQLFVNFKSMDSNWSQVELTNIMKHSIAHHCLNCEKQRVLHTIIETISKQNSKNVVYIRKTIKYISQ